MLGGNLEHFFLNSLSSFLRMPVAFCQASLFSFLCLVIFVSLFPLHSPWLYSFRGLVFICVCFWLLFMCLEFFYGVFRSLVCFLTLVFLSFSLLFLSSQLWSLVFLNWPDFLSVFYNCHGLVCLFLRFVFSGLLFSFFLIFLYCVCLPPI